ncbi:MAG TPA: hypothetical protein VK675_03340 [Candidatus Paceibacterota bacterium]|nr:hypothetical protein [Candidatus Paceibacterota bacterium]
MSNFDGIKGIEVNSLGPNKPKKPAEEANAVEGPSVFSQKLVEKGFKEFTDNLLVSGLLTCPDDYFYNKLEPEQQEKVTAILEKAIADTDVLLKDLKEKYKDHYYAHMSPELKTQLNAIRKSAAKELNKIL